MKKQLAYISFVFSIVMALMAFFCPPLGIIDSSVLWFTA